MDVSQLVNSHQSIKIVPSVEDSLRQLGLDVDIDKNVQIWFKQLQDTWKTWKKSPAVKQHFKKIFLFDNPFRIALTCVIKCSDYKDCKQKSLPCFIIEDLLKWSQSNQTSPDDLLKLPAFHIAIMQRNQIFLNLMVETFQIKTVKDKILPIVNEMIVNDNCRQATQIVSALELYEDISIETLLFPLILQDKLNVIYDYLSESPSQVRPLLNFLDSLLDKKCNIRNFVQVYLEEHKVYNIKYERIHHRPLGKLVARICTKHDIPIETCKNLSKNRTTSGLRYLIYQKYVDHKVSASVWDDLVKDSLNRGEGCADEFINLLIEFDHNEALKWAKYLNIHENDLPSTLKNMTLQEATEENWDTKNTNTTVQNYYELPLSQECIIMVSNTEKFYDIMSILEKCDIVSIDCEWKPSFGASQSQVALIQVATSSCVYLIDTLVLNDKQYSSFWYRFNKSLLDNDEIIKLGFGLDQDLKEIKASIAGLQNIKIKGEGYLDLSTLWKNLNDSGLKFPSCSYVAGKSLSSLVESCFGVPLEKSEQCSNWELRPLRSTQINYAALDAYVLLEIYTYFQNLCTEQKINFEEICNEVMTDKKLKSTKKVKATQKAEVAAPYIQRQIKDVKILVEPDLSYLMGYLRYCGIDTVVMPTSMLWHDAIGFALIEDRFILTDKLKLSSSSKYPQNSILHLIYGSIKEQLQKVFATFNIRLDGTDLSTRCIFCNGIDLKKVSFAELSDIYSKSQVEAGTSTKDQRLYNQDDDCDSNLDNFLSDSDSDEAYALCQSVPKNIKSTCLTSKGAVIDTNDIQNIFFYYISNSEKNCALCDNCGKFHWEEDAALKTISELILNHLNVGIKVN